MRPALIGLCTVFATLAADVRSGSPQESFFSRRYCTHGGSDQSSGTPDCSYSTWEQCVASARGLARYCAENPNWRPQGSNGNERTPRRRTGR